MCASYHCFPFGLGRGIFSSRVCIVPPCGELNILCIALPVSNKYHLCLLTSQHLGLLHYLPFYSPQIRNQLAMVSGYIDGTIWIGTDLVIFAVSEGAPVRLSSPPSAHSTSVGNCELIAVWHCKPFTQYQKWRGLPSPPPTPIGVCHLVNIIVS